MLDFEILNEAGITAGDLHRLIVIPMPYEQTKTISRTTAFKWSRGKSQPADFAYWYVSKLLTAIQIAVAEKKLPLPLVTKRKDRLELLKSIIIV